MTQVPTPEEPPVPATVSPAPPRPRGSGWIWLEWVFAIAILALIVRTWYWAVTYGQLPQPFFYEPNDTFMDWFNTAYWSRDSGAFDTWATVYPPLSFVLMRLVSTPHCYVGGWGITSASVLEARDCDVFGLWMIGGLTLANFVVGFLIYRRLDRRTALPRTIGFALGMPMLCAVERGNIILFCFLCVALAFGPLLHSARLRWLFAGLAVNFKVYLIAAIGALLVRRKWLWVEGAVMSVVGVYLVTYAIIGHGTPIEIFNNITQFNNGGAPDQFLDMWYSVTYQPMVAMLTGTGFPIVETIGSKTVEVGLVVLPAVMHLGQLSILAALGATWLRPEVVPTTRVVFFGVALAIISSEAGGYTTTFLLFFVLMERWRGFARPLAIVLAYVLALPGDILIDKLPPMVANSWLAGRPIEAHFGFGIGIFIRPGLIIIMSSSLAWLTIRDVWVDLRQQGWAGRWRLRRDMPMLPGIIRPTPPRPSRPAVPIAE